MIQSLILICAGGCMRELLWQIEELNMKQQTWQVQGYVDIIPPSDGESGSLKVGDKVYPYLGDDDYLLSLTEETNVAICAGNPELREKIAKKLLKNPCLKFPDLILSDTRICLDVQMGQGCIISMNSRISTNVVLGDFVFLNVGATVCHDGRLGSYTTLSPEVTLAGQVTIGERCNIGLGTKVIQGITIGDNVTTGAGSVIIKDIENEVTAVGVPAKVIRKKS